MAASETVRAKTVTQSRALHARTTPVVETLPTVGLMPTQPQKCAGTRPAQTAQQEVTLKSLDKMRLSHTLAPK